MKTIGTMLTTLSLLTCLASAAQAAGGKANLTAKQKVSLRTQIRAQSKLFLAAQDVKLNRPSYSVRFTEQRNRPAAVASISELSVLWRVTGKVDERRLVRHAATFYFVGKGDKIRPKLDKYGWARVQYPL